MRNLKFRCHRAAWYGGRMFAYARQTIVQRAQNWALIGSGVVGFLCDLAGVKLIYAEGYMGAIIQGFTAIGVMWLLSFIFRFVTAPFQMWSHGKWYGPEFVYNEPLLIFTTRWSPRDNGRVISFHVPEAPPFSLVTCKINIEGAGHRIRAQVCFPNSTFFDLTFSQSQLLPVLTTGPSTMHGARIGARRSLGLNCYSLPDTVPLTVRVYMHSWEKQTA